MHTHTHTLPQQQHQYSVQLCQRQSENRSKLCNCRQICPCRKCATKSQLIYGKGCDEGCKYMPNLCWNGTQQSQMSILFGMPIVWPIIGKTSAIRNARSQNLTVNRVIILCSYGLAGPPTKTIQKQKKIEHAVSFDAGQLCYDFWAIVSS